jgi:hypothetical protein
MAQAQSRRGREPAVLLEVERRRGSRSARWNGRPVPHIIRGRPQPIDAHRPESTMSWTPEEESEEVDPPLLLHPGGPERSEPPSTRNKGRLLRLSEDGALTVYSLDDALRDLEVVSQAVYGNRVPRK